MMHVLHHHKNPKLQLSGLKYKNKSSLIVHLEKALYGIPHLSVVDRWPATPKRARTAH